MRVEQLIQQNYRLFGESDKAISRYILENPQQAAEMNIQQLARASLSSKSSVMRFAQKLGFSGFSELKAYLRWQEGDADAAQEAGGGFLRQALQDVETTTAYLGGVDFAPLYAAMSKAQRFFVIATGVAQQNQATELQRLLHLAAKPVQVLPASSLSNEYRRAMEMLTEQDMIFLLSLSGENPGLKNLLEIPLLKGAKLVSITNFKSNWLAQNADFRYYASSTPNAVPRNWWVQSSSSFFVVIEALVFGYLDSLEALPPAAEQA